MSADLNRLINRVTALENADIKSMVLNALENNASQEIYRYYPDAQISVKNRVNLGRLDVTAKGLWFREFGTGFVGQGTYPGSLPTQSLDFFSRGAEQHTDGWEYAYHPMTKKLGYWFTPSGGKVYGTMATAGLYYARAFTDADKVTIIRQLIRSIGR